MPARRVIIKDTKRYDENEGFIRIPVLEIKQMCGRAGRPKYDREGEAIFLAASEEEMDNLLECYIYAQPEDITSKLGAEPALRTHMLAAIATEYVRNKEEILNFIEKTFFSYRRRVYEIEDMIENVLNFLKKEGLITDEGTLVATTFGKRTSDLYIDPLSAVRLRDALENATWKTGSIGYLHAICSTPDIATLYLRKADNWVEKKLLDCSQDLLLRIPDPVTEVNEYEFFLAELKTACILEDWINELPEDFIAERYHIGPGDIRSRVENGGWLAYSMSELARIFNLDAVKNLSHLVKRIQSGAKEELLDLIRLEGIGRKRARSLFSREIRTVSDVKKTDLKVLAEVEGIGDRLAVKIKKGVEGVR
jgi:helicase